MGGARTESVLKQFGFTSTTVTPRYEALIKERSKALLQD
jgi:hypothetical protein